MKKLILVLLVILGVSCRGVQTVETLEPKTLVVSARALYEGENIKFILPKETMDKSVETFVNRMVCLGHESKPDSAVGKITKAEVRYDEVSKRHYFWLEMLIIDENAIKKINLGLYYYVSVGFTATEIIKTDEGKPVVLNMLGREVSFVSDPLDRDACLER